MRDDPPRDCEADSLSLSGVSRRVTGRRTGRRTGLRAADEDPKPLAHQAMVLELVDVEPLAESREPPPGGLLDKVGVATIVQDLPCRSLGPHQQSSASTAPSYFDLATAAMMTADPFSACHDFRSTSICG